MDPASLHDTLFNSVAEAAIVTDSTGRVSAWNARAEFLYGWSPDEALGRHITDLTVPTSQAADAQQILSALAEGQPWAGEFLVSRRDGSSFWARVRNIPLTSDDGTYQGVLGLSEDISEERRLREALRDERQREEEMLKLAAHELRTPLTSILGFAKRLQRGTGSRGDTDSWREHIDIIVVSAERLRRSMDFVIKLANLDRSQLSLESGPVDFHRVVEEEVSAIQLRSPDALIETEREDNEHIIQGDEDAVRLILANLLDNAVKYGSSPSRGLPLDHAPGGTGPARGGR